MSRPVRIGFQGEQGAFSESALRGLRPDATPVPRPSFQDVVDAVLSGEDDFGVLPVENSLAGGVAAAWDVLCESPVRAIAEILHPVRLCLLAVPGASLERIREVRSHPVALAQCRRFLSGHPWLRPVAVHDTAGAAREVAALADPALAAVASRDAGHRYGLDCLAPDIHDRADNQTRFFLIRRSEDSERQDIWTTTAPGESAGDGAVQPPRPPLKTALLAETDDRPGALRDLLSVFADRGLDLSHIASRPGGTPWTYAFVIEVRHHPGRELEDALRLLAGATRRFRVLGTFPAATPPA